MLWFLFTTLVAYVQITSGFLGGGTVDPLRWPCVLTYFNKKGCYHNDAIGTIKGEENEITRGKDIKAVWMGASCDKVRIEDDDGDDPFAGNQACVAKNIGVGKEPTVYGPCKYIWREGLQIDRGFCIEFKSDLEDDAYSIYVYSRPGAGGRGVDEAADRGIAVDEAHSGKSHWLLMIAGAVGSVSCAAGAFYMLLNKGETIEAVALV